MAEQTDPVAVDLTNCDREPIHIPAAIQPHGVMLVLRVPELIVTQVSDNVLDHLGRDITQALGHSLADVLDAESATRVRVALEEPRVEDGNPRRLTAERRQFDGILHRVDGGALIVELEPVRSAVAADDLQRSLRLSLTDLQVARSLPELRQGVVRAVRRLTGFERVMLYRFDADGHGSVDAEAKEPHLEPYLGLHYPASDIPRQARDLYLKNWLRIIPNARYTPARIIPADRPDAGGPLDLSFAVLRSVSPIHLEYLANMGIHASMSISLVVRGRLWGLIGCLHHSGPRQVRYELRSACEVLGRLTSLQIAALEDRQAAALRAARRGTQMALADAMRANDSPLEALLTRPAELLSLVGAAGAAVVTGDDCSTCGRTPEPALILALADWLAQRSASEPFATATLAALFPAAAPARHVASGLLTFALPGMPGPRLMWFRPEVIQTVDWSGDPRKPVDAEPGRFGPRLHPRRSFELWKEELRLQSTLWTSGDIEAADDLRRYTIEVGLERQVAQTQDALRARDEIVAVVSHDLRNPLGVIQMQAALLSRLAGQDTEDAKRRLLASAESIQRSVDRMKALIDDLLDLAKIEAGRFSVHCRPEDSAEVIDEAVTTLRPLADARQIRVEDELTSAARVHVDRERIFHVLSNLIGNAIRFTPAGGRIVVRSERHERELVVTVADSGPGISEDHLDRVFNRYWQARRSSSAGSGLGLYIAKGIVEAHGGRIWAESPPGSGARFSFTLRLE